MNAKSKPMNRRSFRFVRKTKHRCGPMTSLLLLIVGGVAMTETSIATAQKIYWTNECSVPKRDAWQGVYRANLDGALVEELVTDVVSPHGIALDLNGGKMYWLEAIFIIRADLDGSTVETIGQIPFSGSLQDIALDMAGAKIYWTSIDFSSGGAIYRANLDGSELEVVHAPGNLFRPHVLTLDVGARRMYFGEGCSLFVADMDPPTAPQLIYTYRACTVFPYVGGIGAVTFAPEMQRLYWGEPGGNLVRGKIKCALPEAQEVRTLIRFRGLRGGQSATPRGIAVDEHGGKLYWASYYENRIRRADLDGSDVENILTLRDGVACPSGVALDLRPLASTSSDQSGR